MKQNLISNQLLECSKWNGEKGDNLLLLITSKCDLPQRGGKDFFVLVLEQLMFVKGTGKHWCKYPELYKYLRCNYPLDYTVY